MAARCGGYAVRPMVCFAGRLSCSESIARENYLPTVHPRVLSRMYMGVVRFVRRSVRFIWQQLRCEDSVALEESHADAAFWSAALMWKAHGTSLGGLLAGRP